MLFIDAREVFRQIDRAHREFTEEQIEFLANIVRLYRGEEPELAHGDERAVRGAVPRRRLCGRATGLCKVATIDEIEAQGWSLNPGRYVGTEVEELDEEVSRRSSPPPTSSCAAWAPGPRSWRRAWTGARKLLPR